MPTQKKMLGVYAILCLSAVFVIGCRGKGLVLEELRSKFQDLGDVVGQAEHCAIPTNREEITTRLKHYANQQGANDLEQESLVSYFNASADQSAKNAAADCTPDEKSRTAALLNERLLPFK